MKKNGYCQNYQGISGDIVKQKIDAIVNGANNALLGGGGVDGPSILPQGQSFLKSVAPLEDVPPGKPISQMIPSPGKMGDLYCRTGLE